MPNIDNRDDMATIEYGSLRTCQVGTKCFLSTLLWSLVVWILIFQVYPMLAPPTIQLLEPRYSRKENSFDVSAGIRTPQPTINAHKELTMETVPLAKEVLQPEKKQKAPDTAVLRSKTRNRAQEEAKEHLIRKLAALFPSNELAVDSSMSSLNESGYFYPGREWRDTDGNPIQAHGGGILYVSETQTFYWYGEDKGGRTYRPSKRGSPRVDVLGISCYSSKDLWTWKFEGFALKGEKKNRRSDLYITNVVERPKVIYNDRTKQYVMWMHIDNGNYSKAAVGVAISTQPEGPFDYLGSKRPHGCDSRDMTVFKDDNGDAYIFYSSQTNSELHIGLLTEDYLDVVERGMQRVLIKQRREAPAVFKHKNLYYMVTSGCTSWNPNSALVHAAPSMLGPWMTLRNPCEGGDEELRSLTFFSQGTFVLPLPGLADIFIYMGDRWRPSNLSDSRYVWLPLTMNGTQDQCFKKDVDCPPWQQVSIHWAERWKLPEGWSRPQRQYQLYSRSLWVT